ncbi:MAG: zinc ribbon domain-containing protein [Desulfobacterales bacterium]|nr:MAG: zinc ribbon domain-containing protein [Desulfobacterales bacterium]
MFLIAGVCPKTKILDGHSKRCPACGLSQAYFKRIDHYFNLFFIPLIRVKKGEPFLMCKRCEQTVQEDDRNYHPMPNRQDKRCDHCGQALADKFSYCPYCGKHQ